MYAQRGKRNKKYFFLTDAPVCENVRCAAPRQVHIAIAEGAMAARSI